MEWNVCLYGGLQYVMAFFRDMKCATKEKTLPLSLVNVEAVLSGQVELCCLFSKLISSNHQPDLKTSELCCL